jgi:hypothetical protein
VSGSLSWTNILTLDMFVVLPRSPPGVRMCMFYREEVLMLFITRLSVSMYILHVGEGVSVWCQAGDLHVGEGVSVWCQAGDLHVGEGVSVWCQAGDLHMGLQRWWAMQGDLWLLFATLALGIYKWHRWGFHAPNKRKLYPHLKQELEILTVVMAYATWRMWNSEPWPLINW